ncbi:MAG: hypothetical protein ACI8P0_006783, partial [Planctomycetaceae bacterium]
MYRWLLCTRYLRTRFIALASIISVMLGVATMIVVNSVMSGFSYEMRTRINGILADVDIETNSLNGEADAQELMQRARAVTGDRIEAISATVEVFGLLHFRRGGQWIPRPVTLVGIDPEAESKVSPLQTHLDSFRDIVEDDVITRKKLRPDGASPNWDLTPEALAYRTAWKERQRLFFQPEDDDVDPFEEEPAEQLMPDEPRFDSGQPAGTPNFEETTSEPQQLGTLATAEAVPAKAQGPTVGPATAANAEFEWVSQDEKSPEIIQTAATEDAGSARPGRGADDPFKDLLVPDELIEANAGGNDATADVDAP